MTEFFTGASAVASALCPTLFVPLILGQSYASNEDDTEARKRQVAIDSEFHVGLYPIFNFVQSD